MNKKFTIALITVITVTGGVIVTSAFEAHIVNVTAHVENALRVHPNSPIVFGTVFPQEYFDGFGFDIGTSDSFCAGDQTRVLNIDYVIKQKPKPRPEMIGQESCGANIDEAREYCHNNPDDLTCCFPNLCAYISKTPQVEEPGDVGVKSFHNPETEWATGHLHKKIETSDPNPNDTTDSWFIDLAVPCFEGMCAQDWPAFVESINPEANPDDYILPVDLESEMFGCDLWIEVTDIY